MDVYLCQVKVWFYPYQNVYLGGLVLFVFIWGYFSVQVV